MNSIDWISITTGKMPEEHESIFAKFKGTDKWKPGMFDKISDEVLVTCEYSDGTRIVTSDKTVDGSWRCETSSANRVVPKKVVAWALPPDPYIGP